MINAVRGDVIGPRGGEEEIITDAPVNSYIAGVLYPNTKDPVLDATEELENEGTDGEEDGADPAIAAANRRFPTSMGITFTVDLAGASELEIEISAARYGRMGSEEEEKEEGEETDSEPDPDSAEERWKRIPVRPAPIRLDVSAPSESGDEEGLLDDGLRLFHRVRKPDQRGSVAVTLALINERRAEAWEKDEDSFFQPEIAVRAANGVAAFVERRGEAPSESDEDLRSYDLLFRDSRVYAVGHGCSVQWGDPVEPGRVAELRSEFLPTYALRISESNPDIDPISMQSLAEGSRQQALKRLRALCDGYEEWIRLRTEEVEELNGGLVETAKWHLDECRAASERMRRGVALLADEPTAWRAFHFANRAMLIQRSRSDWLSRGAPGDGPGELGGHAWRPFQIAFILLCLPGIVDGSDRIDPKPICSGSRPAAGRPRRTSGLIAFTIFLRRLKAGATGVTA